MSKKRGSFTRAKLFLVLWLLLAEGILFGGELLGGAFGAWATPQLFFIALGGIFQGIIAPWALAVLLTVVVMTVLIVTASIVIEHDVKQSEKIERVLEKKAEDKVSSVISVTPQLLNHSVVNDQTKQFSVFLEYDDISLLNLNTAEAKLGDKNKVQTSVISMTTTSSPSQLAIIPIPSKLETPPTPVEYNLPMNTPSPETPSIQGSNATIYSPYQPQKSQKIDLSVGNTQSVLAESTEDKPKLSFSPSPENAIEGQGNNRNEVNLSPIPGLRSPLQSTVEASSPETSLTPVKYNLRMNTPSPETSSIMVKSPLSPVFSQAMLQPNHQFASPLSQSPKFSKEAYKKNENKENNPINQGLSDINKTPAKVDSSPKTPVQFSLSPKKSSPETPVEFMFSPKKSSPGTPVATVNISPQAPVEFTLSLVQ